MRDCTKKIPCPKGGMMCCLCCLDKKCPERCSDRWKCWIEAYLPSIKWGIILGLLLLVSIMQFRISHLETEHNFIIDRINQTEINIMDKLDKAFPEEEFYDTDELNGGEPNE